MRTLVVGDIHGESWKLDRLLKQTGYLSEDDKIIDTKNKIVFVGDFADRGPNTPRVIQTVMDLCNLGIGRAVLGNHDKKLLKRLQRYLKDETPPNHSPEVENTFNQYRGFSLEFLTQHLDFLENLPYFLELDCGTKIVHACYDAKSVGKPKKKQELMLYGPVDRQAAPREDGLPNRIPWWEGYDGRHGKVIFGHYSPADTIQVYSEHAVCVDTGVYKTGVLGGYVLETGECFYVS